MQASIWKWLEIAETSFLIQYGHTFYYIWWSLASFEGHTDEKQSHTSMLDSYFVLVTHQQLVETLYLFDIEPYVFSPQAYIFDVN